MIRRSSGWPEGGGGRNVIQALILIMTILRLRADADAAAPSAGCQRQAPDVTLVGGPHRAQISVARTDAYPDEGGVRRRREHGPQLSIRQVDEPKGVDFFEEEPQPMPKKGWIISGLGEAPVGVVCKGPQEHPRDRLALPRRHSSGEGAAVPGPGGTVEDLAAFNRREHARRGLRAKEVQEGRAVGGIVEADLPAV